MLITLAIKVATYQIIVLPRASQEPHPIAKCSCAAHFSPSARSRRLGPPTPRAGAAAARAARSPSLRGSVGSARRLRARAAAPALQPRQRAASAAVKPSRPGPRRRPRARLLVPAHQLRGRLARRNARHGSEASPFQGALKCGQHRAAESCALPGRRRCSDSALLPSLLALHGKFLVKGRVAFLV